MIASLTLDQLTEPANQMPWQVNWYQFINRYVQWTSLVSRIYKTLPQNDNPLQRSMNGNETTTTFLSHTDHF